MSVPYALICPADKLECVDDCDDNDDTKDDVCLSPWGTKIPDIIIFENGSVQILHEMPHVVSVCVSTCMATADSPDILTLVGV